MWQRIARHRDPKKGAFRIAWQPPAEELLARIFQHILHQSGPNLWDYDFLIKNLLRGLGLDHQQNSWLPSKLVRECSLLARRWIWFSQSMLHDCLDTLQLCVEPMPLNELFRKMRKYFLSLRWDHVMFHDTLTFNHSLWHFVIISLLWMGDAPDYVKTVIIFALYYWTNNGDGILCWSC